ncbi:MAG: tyrosine-type recombinase/integrase [Pseudomonadota bacterium]
MPKVKLDAGMIPLLFCPAHKAKETYFDEAIVGFVVEKRPDGGATYALRYRDEYGRQRQYKIANAADVSFAEAKKEAIRVKARVSVGQNPVEERKANRRIPTVAELAARYLDYARTYKRSADIDERYLRIHLLPRFGKLHLDQLDQTEIMEWLQSNVQAGYAQATVNRWQVILSHMMRMAKKWGLPGADQNPLEGVKQKDCNNRIERYLTPAETARLKQAVEESPNPLLKHIVALLLLTGCRKRELLDAKWEEVNLDRKVWRIPTSKTGRPRHVPLSEDAIAVLRRIPRFGKSPYIVPNPKTLKPFVSIYNSWDSARRAARVPDVRIHDLRHSAASNLVNAGRSLYIVAKLLGHSNTKTTERYAHLDAGVMLEAVNAGSEISGTTWANEI